MQGELMDFTKCKKLISQAHKQCSYLEYLPADDERWVDLDENGVRGNINCIDLLVGGVQVKEIEDETAYLLFSGYRGGGKSTTLKQVQARLEEDDFEVLFVDTTAYLNTSVPIETYEILLTVTGELENRYGDKLEGTLTGIWKRIANFLNSEVEIKELELSTLDAGKIKFELRENPDFRRSLQQLLDRRQKQSGVIRQCLDYMNEFKAKFKQICPDKTGLVIIVDSLEKLRGQEATAIRESLIQVFDLYADRLHLPFHTIYTVPPWLQFTPAWTSISGSFQEYFLLPMCDVTLEENGSSAGIDVLMEMLQKRIRIEDLFGENSNRALRNLIELSGGYPRDLLRLLQGILLNMFSDKVNCPLDAEKLEGYIDREVKKLVETYDQSLYLEDVRQLNEVSLKKDIPYTHIEPERLADWLDHHFILCYRNGDSKYDLHPLLKRKSDRYQKLLKATKDSE